MATRRGPEAAVTTTARQATATAARSAQRRRARRLLAAAVAVAAAAAIAQLVLADRMARDVRLEYARRVAAEQLVLLEAVREYYGSEILPTVGAEVTHLRPRGPGALPASVTFINELGERGRSAARFSSRHPFRGGGGGFTEHDARALSAFEAGADSVFWLLESGADAATYYYAEPVRMREACVDCHNSHPASTKTDWAVGDIRGVASIRSEVAGLGTVEALAQRWHLAVMAVSLLAAGALSVMLFRAGWRRLEAARLSDARRSDAVISNARRRIRELADFDSLTGLANRAALDAAARAHDGPAVALHVDLDRFQQINDTLGHDVGDHVLRAAAQIVASAVGDRGVLARVGGDEFVLLAPYRDPSDGDAVERLAADLVERLRAPIAHEAHALLVGASVGYAWDAEARTALINADIALQEAKRAGRGQASGFTAALQTRLIEQRRTADEIRIGLREGAFFPYFQPQFHAVTRAAVGVEALARWRRPGGQIATPAAFLSVAEDIGAEAEIDDAILQSALAEHARLAAMGLAPACVSVNVSMRRLSDPDLAKRLDALDPPRGAVAFEILEAAFLDSCEPQVSWNIDMIRERGIGIEIDDFGSGRASILGVLNVRPDRLKIDRQLVMPIVEDPSRRPLIRSIVDIGLALGVAVTAEGVETEAHAEILAELGCDTLQGFGLARPMSGAALERFLAERRARAPLDDGAAAS